MLCIIFYRVPMLLHFQKHIKMCILNIKSIDMIFGRATSFFMSGYYTLWI